MDTYVNAKNTSKDKIHEQDIVVTKACRVCMKVIMIRGEVDGKSKCVSSLIKYKYLQGKPLRTIFAGETILSIDKNYDAVDLIKVRKVVLVESYNLDKTMKAFSDYDSPLIENMIDVIMNFEVPTTEIGPTNLIHDSLLTLNLKRLAKILIKISAKMSLKMSVKMLLEMSTIMSVKMSTIMSINMLMKISIRMIF